ncbi:hypothetical protein [Paraburkholderia sp. RL17-381-BIF-C]|uniref:hypothetical protein n=1 Tax=Paraburkholderia sp. RL17-381-BIF-C TaxID=3031635 RepID=UPI0038BA1AC0
MKKFSKENQESSRDGTSAMRTTPAMGKDARATGSKDAGKGMVAPAPTKPAKRRAGRPSRYRPEFCEALLAHFDGPAERVFEVVKQDGRGGTIVVHEARAKPFPTLGRFSDTIGVAVQTLRNWAKRYPDFGFAFERARDRQASLLIEGGLSGAYDSRFAVMAAKNLLGWRDKAELTVTATVTQASVGELDAIYERGMAEAAAGKATVAARKQRSEGGPRHD